MKVVIVVGAVVGLAVGVGAVELLFQLTSRSTAFGVLVGSFVALISWWGNNVLSELRKINEYLVEQREEKELE